MTNKVNELSEVSDDVFAIVARELATGKPDEALWTKAFALQNGNESATKAHYIRLRAEQIQRAASGRIEAESELAADDAPHIAGPWARYFARYLDLALSVCLTLLLFLLLIPTITAANVQMTGLFWVVSLLVISLIALLPWVIDAAIVTLFGNSLGKAIWGITVRHKDGRPLAFKEVLNRNFLVALHGFWTGMTPLTFIPHIISYKKLKNDGATSWDAKGNYEVLSSDPGAFRKIVGVALLVVALVMLGMMEFGTNLYAQKTKIDTTSAKPGLDNGRLEAQTPPSTPPEKEIAELSKRAEAGDAAAQVQLGGKYLAGNGVPQNSSKAFQWFQKAALQGYAGGQHNLGYMYGTGSGIPQDQTEAFKWFQKSAQQGVSSSQSAIGERYYSGKGVTQDFANAFTWNQKAAVQGDARGQYVLAVMYANGDGVLKDNVLAYSWANLATNYGSLDAPDLRASIEERMTPAEIAEAQRLSASWKIGQLLSR